MLVGWYPCLINQYIFPSLQAFVPICKYNFTIPTIVSTSPLPSQSYKSTVLSSLQHMGSCSSVGHVTVPSHFFKAENMLSVCNLPLPSPHTPWECVYLAEFVCVFVTFYKTIFLNSCSKCCFRNTGTSEANKTVLRMNKRKSEYGIWTLQKPHESKLDLVSVFKKLQRTKWFHEHYS